MGIYDKLAAIQAKLFVPKDQRNDFGKYKYRSCEDILKQLKPICNEVKCVTHITNDMAEVGGRVYVKAIVTLTDLETGEHIESIAYAREEESKKGQDGSQITGTSSSYARKYALAGMFCIDNEKDSDATNDAVKDEDETPKRQNAKKPDKAKDLVKEASARAKVIAFCKRHEMSDESIQKICKLYGIKDLNEMKLEQAEHYIKTLENKGGNINE